jgi:hypothetical protein
MRPSTSPAATSSNNSCPTATSRETILSINALAFKSSKKDGPKLGHASAAENLPKMLLLPLPLEPDSNSLIRRLSGDGDMGLMI